MMRKRSDRRRIHVALFPSLSIPAVAALAFSVAGCESLGLSTPSLPAVPSLFGEKKEEKLPGKRISVLSSGDREGIGGVEASGPIVLPPAVVNASWSQPGGVPSNSPGHLSLSGAPQIIWSASIGEGTSKRTRLTAVPIVYDNKVFTLDAEGTARALSAANGDTIWKVSLYPSDDKQWSLNPFNSNNAARAGFGGGLAVDGGRLFVATGFGTVVALDPNSGKPLWTKKLEIPIREAPTAVDGRVFIVNAESETFCLGAEDGKELWSQKGLPENAATLTNASPAVYGGMVFVPYPSGEIAALDIRTGQPKWTESLSKGEITSSGTVISEPARPVVDREAVFAMSRSGQLVATARERGDRLWSREIRGSQTPWVAGDAIFAVDMTGKLVALNRKDGKVRWLTALPGGGLWSGPVLAGGRLWLASSKGHLVSVDAVSGTVASQTDLGAPVMIPPVVAEGRMYILTDKAKLIALN